jgi:hypothetical protein
VDRELPEDAAVTVIAREDDETFKPDPKTEQMLLDAMAQCERGETILIKQVLSELRTRE